MTVPLFVVLADGRVLDDELRAQITSAVRQDASPRHVPDQIIAVPAIPPTRTGKKLEVPVKRILLGSKLADVLSLGAVDDPPLWTRSRSSASRDRRPGSLLGARLLPRQAGQLSAARSAGAARKATPDEEIDSAAASMPTSSIIAMASAAFHSGR